MSARPPSVGRPRRDPLALIVKAVGGQCVDLGSMDPVAGQKLIDEIDRQARLLQKSTDLGAREKDPPPDK